MLTLARWVMLRVTWSSLLTAGTAIVVLLLSLMLDHKRTRPAGLLGMSVAIFQYVLALLLIWLSASLWGTIEEDVGLTMLFAALTGFVATALLVLVRTQTGKVAGIVGVSTCALSLVLFLTAVWLPGRTWEHDEWFVTGWAVGGYGLMASACLLNTGPKCFWRWIGVGMAVVGLTLTSLEIWGEGILDEEWLFVFASTPFVIGFANIHMVPRAGTAHRWIRLGTIAAAVVTAVCLDALVFNAASGGAEDVLERLAAAGGIVMGCGSLAVVVFVALQRRRGADEDPTVNVKLEAVCPRCRSSLHLPVGSSLCGHCGLRLRIWFESPRCSECGYLLTAANAGRCPECGTPVQPDPAAPAGVAPAADDGSG